MPSNDMAATFTRSGLAAVKVLMLAVTLLGFSTAADSLPQSPRTSSARETIYVLHSVRQERVMGSTWCTMERTGFSPVNSEFYIEERFSLSSVVTRPMDGRVGNAEANTIGELHTCLGRSTDPNVLNFYAEGKLAGLPFSGSGDCHLMQPDHPAKGIMAARCYLDLRGLPSDYAGGLATSNTIISDALLGGETSPGGYLQTSIATFRLWKAP